MTIELTIEQSQAIATQDEAFLVIDPRTKQAYRLVREELFRKMQVIPYDDSEWTPSEMAALSGTAFADLDDTDYSEYLDKP